MREIVFVYEWNIGLVFLFDGCGLWQTIIQYQNFLNVILISTVEQMSKSHRDLFWQHVWQTHNAYVAQSAVTFYARTIFPAIWRRSLFCSTCSKCNNVLCADDSVRKIYNENQYKMISLDYTIKQMKKNNKTNPKVHRQFGVVVLSSKIYNRNNGFFDWSMRGRCRA